MDTCVCVCVSKVTSCKKGYTFVGNRIPFLQKVKLRISGFIIEDKSKNNYYIHYSRAHGLSMIFARHYIYGFVLWVTVLQQKLLDLIDHDTAGDWN